MNLKECAVCRSADLEFRDIVFKDDGRILPLAICKDCGHAVRSDYWSFAENLTIQTGTFDNNAIRPALSELKWPHRPRLIANGLERLARKRGQILDIGCGTGMWLAALGDGWEKFGVELSPVAAKIAEEVTHATIYNGEIESFDALPNSFDVITAFAVIEHMSDPGFLLRWSFDHLKPGGILIVMTGDRESSTAQAMDADWPLYYSIEHLSFFSARSLSQMVKSFGFRVLRMEWRFNYMPWGLGSRAFKAYQKVKEILGLIESPQHDHLYLYAQKSL